MTRAQRHRLATPIVGIYWILLGGGVLLYAATERDQAVPLGIGALAGTLVGQLLALRNLRALIAILVAVAAACLHGALLPRALAVPVFWQAFAPAVLCGYWSLGDRSALAACWFPAVLWLLAVLGWTDTQLASDVHILAFGSFVGLFLVLLRLRETRRIALWCTVAPVPLAEAKPVAMLKKPPRLVLPRTSWGISLAALTVALTAWLGPTLWRLGQAANGVAEGQPLPCCPSDDALRSHRRDYLDAGGVSADIRLDCGSCPMVAVGDPIVEPGGRPAVGPGRPALLAPPLTAGPVPPVSDLAPGVPAIPAVPLASARPVTPPPSSPVPTALGSPVATVPAFTDAPPTGASSPPSLAPWLVTLAIAVLIGQLAWFGLSPVRRLVTLRHLRQPLWPETVGQQVSNSWQLALIGLRDAGWIIGAAEQPQALARRVGIVSLAHCATILERARHGLGIDADDLAAMRESADAAYAAARAKLGPIARLAGWLRWPLT